MVRDLFNHNLIVSKGTLESFTKDGVKGLFHLGFCVNSCYQPRDEKLESLHVVFKQKCLVEEIRCIREILGYLFVE